MYYKNNTILKI